MRTSTLKLTLAAAIAVAALASCSFNSLLKSGAGHAAPRAAGANGVPQDYITGGGWYIIQSGAVATSAGNRAVFGFHGGVKNGTWWGDGVYLDYGIGLQATVTAITGYTMVGSDGTDSTGHPTGTREIFGTMNTNLAGSFTFVVKMTDNGEPGTQDTFSIALEDSSGKVAYEAQGNLGGASAGGGNIQLHRGNASSVAPSTPPAVPANNPFPG